MQWACTLVDALCLYRWDQANLYCISQGSIMCSKSDICSAPGFGFSTGSPLFGWVEDALTRVAVADAPNMWLALGQAFVNMSQVCMSYEQLDPNGSSPSVAEQQSWQTNKVACCNNIPPGNPYVQVDEGTTSGVDLGDPAFANPASVAPPIWQIYSSQLRFKGSPWGNPYMPGFNYSLGHNQEKCSAYAAGSLLYLNLDRAFAWNNYTMVASVSSSTMGGFVFRFQDPQHYYRLLTDRVVRLTGSAVL